MPLVLPHEPQPANSTEHEQLVALAQFLDHLRPGPLMLTDAGGKAAGVPASVVALVQQAVSVLARGQMVTVAPIDRLLTTRQAADILNVSRPYLVKLLDTGVIASIKTGTHRRVRLEDLLDYRARRDAQRHAALVEITRIGEEFDQIHDLEL